MLYAIFALCSQWSVRAIWNKKNYFIFIFIFTVPAQRFLFLFINLNFCLISYMFCLKNIPLAFLVAWVSVWIFDCLKKVFHYPSFIRDICAVYRILDWLFFLFSTLMMSVCPAWFQIISLISVLYFFLCMQRVFYFHPPPPCDVFNNLSFFEQFEYDVTWCSCAHMCVFCEGIYSAYAEG